MGNMLIYDKYVYLCLIFIKDFEFFNIKLERYNFGSVINIK